MTQREELNKFELDRIKALQEERLHIQQKTFTKWMNSFLQKARMEVDDIFTDLSDGKKLLKLLEIISGEKLGKPNNGKMRVHKIENVNKSLAFLHTKVRLESIGAEDIVDGNKRLILGLIWTIILRFQIQDIEIEVDEDNESSEKKSAKEALLLWCQRKTSGYPYVNIQDFTQSWRSGMAFNALIHAHRPDLINYNALNPSNHIDNLTYAFEVAQKELGVPKLLDPEDVDTNKPDEKSVLTCVSSYYHTFAKKNSEIKQGRRIANIIAQLMEIDRLQNNYEFYTTNLLNWIQMKIVELDDRKLPNSLDKIQNEFFRFKDYRTVEKPPKYKDRIEIEALLFVIQTKIKALGQPLYVPPEGKLVHDIEKNWVLLEKAEYRREVALREELLRLEKLENLAFLFEKKSALREGFLKEMIQVLSDPRYGNNLSQIEAHVKKHEAISADILSRAERFQSFSLMADELVNGNYHGKDKIKKKEKQIMNSWEQLLTLLHQHQGNLQAVSSLMTSLRDVDAIRNEIQETVKSLNADVNVPVTHMLAVEDLLQRHNLLEAQISLQEETIKKLNNVSKSLLNKDAKSNNILARESSALQKRLESLNSEYTQLVDFAKLKREKLEEAKVYYKFVQDEEEEEAYIVERQRICQAVLPSKDLLGVISLQQKHAAMEAEIKAHKNPLQKIIDYGESLIASKHPESNDIVLRIENLKKQWQTLHELADQKSKQLSDAIEAFQYHADANEAESWMKEKLQLVTSEDYGKDEASALALLQRHSRLEGEIKAYENDIKRLNVQSEKMLKSGIASLFMICGDAFSAATAAGTEVDASPREEWTEELVEKEVLKEVYEDITVPQVKALYPFTGQDGFNIAKGEQLILLQKTNQDWWNVRKNSREKIDGFVPANYVKDCEPKIVKKLVKKPVKVLEKQRVKRLAPPKPKKMSKRNNRRRLSIICDAEGVEQRQKNINTSYDELLELCKVRRQFLEDTIQLLRFNRECDAFESWMKTTESALIETSRLYHQQINQTQAISDPIEILRKKFENFITDLSANRSRLNEIDEMVVEFTSGRQQHYSAAIIHRQNQIHTRWDKLNRLMNDLGKSVEGLTTIDFFNTTCDETKEWMFEKLNKVDHDDYGKDLKTVQALHRRHENVERELAPIEERLYKVNMLADSVKNAFPNEKAAILLRQKELKDLWDKLKEKAVERKIKLDESLGLQVLKNSAKDLLNWTKNVKQELNNEDVNLAKDVATVEILLKNHEDLGNEILSHDEEFNDLQQLGKQLMKQVHNDELPELLKELKNEQEFIHNCWQQKDNWLRQCKDLMIFNQEADHLDTITNSHQTFLEFDDLGTTLDDVEALIKRHENFIATLLAQDERLHLFNEMAEKLISANHYELKLIDGRRKQVIERRHAVKEKALARKHLLADALAYQKFKADADDFISWCADKKKAAMDDSYRDLNNIERKLQKHEAFEAELGANKSRLASLRQFGQTLIENKHYASEQISKILKSVNSLWDELCTRTDERGKGIRQANGQLTYNKTLDHAREKFNELNKNLSSDELGSDLRSCKELIKKHQAVENEAANWETKITELIEKGEEMAQTHFDGTSILNASKEVKDSFARLKDPLAERKHKLHEALKYHEFEFTVNVELHWISEHVPAASSKDVGQNLTDAQNLLKKNQKLEREIDGHEPHIEKTLSIGEALIAQDHYANKEITKKCSELVEKWQQLKSLIQERKKKLDSSLKIQSLLSEANEVEAWINEKLNILSSNDFGKDEDTVIKLLTKQKAIELEIDTYSGLIVEMNHQTKKFIETHENVNEKIILNRMQDIDQQMQNLQKLSNLRRLKLMESKHLHEFYSETDDFLSWINEQMQTAMSEDFGRDYEGLLILQSRFYDFKCKVSAHEERFKQCKEFANKLSKTQTNDNIEHRMAKVEEAWSLLLDHVEARDQKLNAAAKIHRFNRDVAEAISRIQEKYSIINNTDLGRDLHSVQSLIRRHEVFENDLVALETQLQILVDDSVKLQAAYPGGNAEHILEQQKIVVEHWNGLQEKVSFRKEQLQAAYQLQRFIASVRDLEQWANTLTLEMETHEKVRDAQGAQLIKAEHERIKAEIEARESVFSAVVKTGEIMITEHHHYASEEIKVLLAKLLKTRERLHATWQLKKIYLDQLIDLHFFLRDAKAIEQLSSQQEHYLLNAELGNTVDQVENNVKKHEAFEKLMSTQDEKLVSLQESGMKLLKQNHFESDTIRKRIDEITAKRAKVKELSISRRHRLADALILAQFRRDASEVESWIDEKHKQLEAVDDLAKDVKSAEKQLARHNEYRSEIDSRVDSFEKVIREGEAIIKKGHHMSEEVKETINRISRAHSQLLETWKKRQMIYEQNLDAQLFKQDVGELESWIESKEKFVLDEQLGDSVSVVEELIRKHEDFENAMTAQEEKIKAIQRITLIEDHFNRLKQEEQARREQEKLEQMKRQKRNHEDNHSIRTTEQLPPVECEGFLDRKQELQSGGKKANTRSWKSYYTVLCGQLLCFFKDKEYFINNIAAAPPVSVLGARCSRALNYTKRKYVFRLQLNDGTEFLFTANDEATMLEWLNKISFHASLPPSMQLLSYDAHKNASLYSGGASNSTTLTSISQVINENNSVHSNHGTKYDTSSQSSSSPEMRRVSSNPTGLLASTSRVQHTNSLPPALMQRDQGKKPPPPLPPPRTTTMVSQISSDRNDHLDSGGFQPIDETLYENQRVHNEKHRSSSFRQSYPDHRRHQNGDYNNDNHNNLHMNVSHNVFVMPPPIPNTMFNVHNTNSLDAMRMPMYVQPTYFDTESDNEEWLSHHYDLHYAPTKYQNIPVARHMSLPKQSSRPQHPLQSSTLPNAPSTTTVTSTTTTTSSEDDKSSQKAHKKKSHGGVIGFFKRNK